jgi:DUF4097 and DUF4098 domain-containing protein YvlB
MLGLQHVLFRLTVGFLIVAAASALAGQPTRAGNHTDRQTRTIASLEGKSISIEVTVGTVRIEGSARPDATVDVERTAAAGLSQIPVTLDEHDSTVRIRAVQADGATDPSFRADITLRVPSTTVFSSVRILEGRLVISGLRAEINADVRRGPIEATDIQGVVRLETGIGDVVANRVTLSTPGLLRLRTFNGDVRLTLTRRPPDARILALALNGTVASDIPLQKKEMWGPRWGEATLGSGEPVISIDVVTGAIQIKVAG